MVGKIQSRRDVLKKLTASGTLIGISSGVGSAESQAEVKREELTGVARRSAISTMKEHEGYELLLDKFKSEGSIPIQNEIKAWRIEDKSGEGRTMVFVPYESKQSSESFVIYPGFDQIDSLTGPRFENPVGFKIDHNNKNSKNIAANALMNEDGKYTEYVVEDGELSTKSESLSEDDRGVTVQDVRCRTCRRPVPDCEGVDYSCLYQQAYTLTGYAATIGSCLASFGYSCLLFAAGIPTIPLSANSCYPGDDCDTAYECVPPRLESVYCD